MLNVNNAKIIRKISFKSLLASKKRNIIAIIAIALMTILFTATFTLFMSIVSTYQLTVFKQLGNECHGSFKNVSVEQEKIIANNKYVKELGERIILGIIEDGKFIDKGAEISYMDENATKWGFSEPSVGKMPERIDEISMDTKSLEKLGIAPVLGSTVSLSYSILTNGNEDNIISGEFVLVGYWDYDPLVPVHFINISKEYAESIIAENEEQEFGSVQRELNVMLNSDLNISGKMAEIFIAAGGDLAENVSGQNIRYGVNPGYITSQRSITQDSGTVMAIIALILLIGFSGYLIIYNIFKISVAGDTRFYGLLKTIGVTPKQLKRIIFIQAIALSVIAIPIGLGAGYLIGYVFAPLALSITTFSQSELRLSTSPLIFVFSSFFALATVLVSCNKPGRIAGKISPIEAVRYIEIDRLTKKRQKTRGAGIFRMALANLGRNRSRTTLVVLSLSLLVVLFATLTSLLDGFNLEKDVDDHFCADFIIKDYNETENLEESQFYFELEKFDVSLKGFAYTVTGVSFEDESYSHWAENAKKNLSEEEFAARKDAFRQEDGTYRVQSMVEAFDAALFSKMELIEGDMDSLKDLEAHNIAVAVRVDEQGNIVGENGSKFVPQIGDNVRIVYADEVEYYLDKSETGTFYREKMINPNEVTYTVTARVVRPWELGEGFVYADGNSYIVSREVLERDSKRNMNILLYAFDAANENEESMVERFLQKKSAGNEVIFSYQSKETYRREMEQVIGMFSVVGGFLCLVIGLIGVLNYINTIMTGIVARKKELAILRAVGMSGKQMKKMLIYEGMLYTLGSGMMCFVLLLILMPLENRMFESIFGFYKANYSIFSVIVMFPIYVLLGIIVPVFMYKKICKKSIVENLMAIE